MRTDAISPASRLLPRNIRLRPLLEKRELRGAIGHALAFRVDEKTQRIARLEFEYGDGFLLDGEDSAPRATADFEMRGAAARSDPARAVRRRIAREQLEQARAKID